MSYVCASPHRVVQVEVAKQYLLLGLIVVQYRTDVCQHGAVALAASHWVVDVVYGNVLSLLSVVAELYCKRADVSAMFLELPLLMVQSFVDEEAYPSVSCLASCWAAEVEEAFCRMVCRRRKGVPPWFLDGQDVVLVDPGVSQHTRHDHVS